MKDYKPTFPQGYVPRDPATGPSIRIGPNPLDLDRASRNGKAIAERIADAADMAARKGLEWTFNNRRMAKLQKKVDS